MAFPQLIMVLAIALAFSRMQLALCSEVKGSVSCTDCGPNYDYSGIRVVVKCDQVKKLSEAITDKKGDFETTLPSDAPTSKASTSPKCLAKLFGGPYQIYARKQNMVSEVVMARGDKNEYTLLTPLIFSKSCHGKCAPHGTLFASSKTFDFTIPPDYGLPPVSDVFSFFPIIGIP